MQAKNWRLMLGILALALCAAPSALAATHSSEGTTSGQASGSTAEPSTATQKHAPGDHASAATGNAGEAAKKGVEAGAAPKGSSEPSNTH